MVINFKLLVSIYYRTNTDVTHSNGHALAAVIESNCCWINLNLIWRTRSYLHFDMCFLLLRREWPSQLYLIEVRKIAMDKDQMSLRKCKRPFVQVRYFYLLSINRV